VSRRASIRLAVCMLALAAAGAVARAAVVNRRSSRFDRVVVADPSWSIGIVAETPDAIPGFDQERAGWAAFQSQNGGGWNVFVDRRSGSPLLVQGPGVRWFPLDAKPVLQDVVGKAHAFVRANETLFKVRDAQLVLSVAGSGPVDKDHTILLFERAVDGVKVDREQFLLFVTRGSLSAFGANSWGPLEHAPKATVDKATARQILYGHMGILGTDAVTDLAVPEKVLLPATAHGRDEGAFSGAPGTGISYELVWRFVVRVAGEPGTWSGSVDAASGKVVSLFDDTKYAQVKGGVYPVSDDQVCPDGCEQPAWPMPYADVTINGSPSTAGDMGIFACSPAGGTAVTRLAGPYVAVNDTCGAVNQSVTCDTDLDLQQGTGTDCVVPPGASAGNTHSARTGFYHLNRIAEKGRAWLPANTWLQSQLTDNINLDQTCNAYWNGATVNFFKSGGGCNNTGEIAGVFLHEWGHGLDNNDGGGYDDPTESYADITALMSTHVSCVGRGFYQSGNCGGYGDACLNCTGIRDQDWNMHASHTPATPAGFVQSNCGGGDSPCGREQHCETYVAAEALWDLAVRDLPAAGLDPDTAWQLTDKLWYESRQGSGGNAYNCSLPSSDGCNSGSWFTKLRNIDDDDGNLNNGTPHAAAIFAAFNRHAIACGAASDASNQSHSSCPSLGAPTLTASAGSGSASLSWAPVPGAANYLVLRNDQGCASGHTIIATVPAPATTYTDTDLPNGFTTYYAVQAQGSNTACEGALSACASVTPQPFAGTIKLDRSTYGCSSVLTVSVMDANIGAPTTTANIFSTTEPTPETIVLTENPPGSGTYVGTISSTSASPVSGDGLISVHDGDTITAQYIDADDGQGGHNILRQATAVADCVPPAISQVQAAGVSDVQATITWSTNESSTSVVNWGPLKPPGQQSSMPGLVNAHSVLLTGLQSCTVYYYSVQSADSVGNFALDDNGGNYYHFETLGNFPGSGLQPCHQGRIFLDATTYSCSSTVGLRVIDIDLNRDPSVADTTSVTLTSTTETSPETAILTETGPNTSVFTGSIQTAPGAPVQDGKLQLANGDLITATYHDADDGSGQPAISFATAVGDCAGPAFSSVRVADQPPFRATVSWTTSEPSSSRLDYGTTTALGKTVSDPALVTSHALTITDLNSCSLEYFKVSGADVYGNTTVDDRGGALYTFESGRVPGAVFVDGFESSSGWSLTGEWQIAPPQGKGGSSGYPDPPSAYSGSKVLGTDLTGLGSWPGDYEPNVSIDATSPTIDCRNLHNATLISRRWLNVEPGDTAQILGYNRGFGSIWKSLGGPFGGNYESAWSVQRYDVSAFADGYNRFQIRFHLDSNASTQESGWNIDDVVLKDGTLPDQEACGSCANKPSFAGLSSATDVDPCADTGIALSWPAAASWGSGTSGTYAVYRDTTPNFTPSAANRLVAGLTGTTYTDASAPNATTFYYLVRAENNETCSSGPNNSGVTDDNTSYRSSRDDTSQPVPSDLGSTVRVAAINDVIVRLTWSAAAGAASYDVLRADNPQMTGSVVVGHTTQTFFDDVGELVDLTSRYYVVRGVNTCGTEGP